MQTNRSDSASEVVYGAAQTESHGKKRGDAAQGQTDGTGFAALLQALAVGQSLHTAAPIQTQFSAIPTVVREHHGVSSAEPSRAPSSQRLSGRAPTEPLGSAKVKAGAKENTGQAVQARSFAANVHAESQAQSQAQARSSTANVHAQSQTLAHAQAQFKVLHFDTGSGLGAAKQSEMSQSKGSHQDNLAKSKLSSEDRTTVARPAVNHSLVETKSSTTGAGVRKGLAESGRNQLPETTAQTNHARHIPAHGPATEFRTERHTPQESRGSEQQWMTGASFVSLQHNAAVPEHTATSTTISLTDSNLHDQFAAMVARQVKAGEEKISVKVHPEGMGDIVVTVGRRADGLQVHVEANSQQTVALLTQQTPQMTDAIRALGIDLTDVQVSYGQASLTQDHGSQQQGQQQAQATPWTGISVEKSSQTTLLANDNPDWLSGTISLRV